MFAHYLSVTAGANVNTKIGIAYDAAAYSKIPVITNLAGSNNPPLDCATPTTFVQTYVDFSSTHTATGITITVTTYGGNFGLRELFVIVKLCDGVCTGCTGYYSSNCTGCADPNRLSNITTSATNNFTGTCVCVGSYYQEPVVGACVQLCPALPIETFGDAYSRKCVTNCPNGTYAYTDTYMCVADCPVTSVVSGSLIFKDQVYWRCVPNCPAEAPYACKNISDRTCYSICPNTSNTVGQPLDYFAVSGMFPECVSVCPYNSTFTTFGYQGKCVPRCPSGTWGDPFSKLCLSNCTSTSFLYKDNSGGTNFCVFNCSDLNYFRDNTTYTCVLTCPGSLFGEVNRECVVRCANGSFGLPFGNRKCVKFCPDGWWGEPDANVCVNTTQRTFIAIQNVRPIQLTRRIRQDTTDMLIITQEHAYTLINVPSATMLITLHKAASLSARLRPPLPMPPMHLWPIPSTRCAKSLAKILISQITLQDSV